MPRSLMSVVEICDRGQVQLTDKVQQAGIKLVNDITLHMLALYAVVWQCNSGEVVTFIPDMCNEPF